LLVFVLQRRHGDGWLEKVSTEEQRTKWAAARENDRSGRTKRGAVDVPGGPLDYAEFREVLAIASDVWAELLTPALGKKASTMPFLSRVADLRNPVGHSRELLPFEQDLISGIAGDIRNRVTIFMSGKDPQGDHYPRIDSITDSFGNTTSEDGPGTHRPVRTGLTLNYGDTVTFQCRGTDPHGRLLQWRFMTLTSKTVEPVYGDDVEMSYTFDSPQDSGERISVSIVMQSSSDFHRYGYGDEIQDFHYRVLPPDPSLQVIEGRVAEPPDRSVEGR
jgi:hypothetical protein